MNKICSVFLAFTMLFSNGTVILANETDKSIIVENNGLVIDTGFSSSDYVVNESFAANGMDKRVTITNKNTGELVYELEAVSEIVPARATTLKTYMEKMYITGLGSFNTSVVNCVVVEIEKNQFVDILSSELYFSTSGSTWSMKKNNSVAKPSTSFPTTRINSSFQAEIVCEIDASLSGEYESKFLGTGFKLAGSAGGTITYSKVISYDYSFNINSNSYENECYYINGQMVCKYSV